MADLVIPGLGTVVEALAKVLKLCTDMKEVQGSCIRLHDRLNDILSEIRRMESRRQMPSSGVTGKYVGIIATYHECLERYCGKPLFLRLLRHRNIMDELLAIQQDVSMLFGMLNLAAAASMMEWRAEWEADRRIQLKVLAATVSSDAAVRCELQSGRAQTEALMTLAYVLERHPNSQDADMKLVKQLKAAVTRTSNVELQRPQPWFIPSDEVKFQPIEFDRGSFGTVHRGVWGSGANVVVKRFIIDGPQMNERAQQRIEKEITLWYGLTHPNVIQMFGASHVSLPPFIVCEDATNGNLCSFLTRNGNMSQAWRLLYQAALGLEYVHKNGIVHGDLKLNNILVGADGVAKLSDFGLSTARTCSTMSKQNANAPRVSGALRWRAPECLHRRPTFLSDVYSLAMCIIEAFEGCPPFNHFADDDSIREALRHGEIPDRPDNLDDEAWELVVAMTATDPKQRASLTEVIAKLKVLADAETANSHVGWVETVAAAESEPEEELDIKRLVTLLESGTDEEKAKVAIAMGKLACDNDSNRVSIAREGGIPPLVTLVKTGSHQQKIYAAATLGNLASNNDTNRVSIAREGGISPLVTLVKTGTQVEKENAAYALGILAFNNDANRVSIAREGGIPPLVSLVKTGNDQQKKYAAHALGNLAINSANRVSIAREGGISPLVMLVKTGSDEQKENSARTLSILAFNNDANRVSIGRVGGIPPIVALMTAGTEEQRRFGAYALGQLAINDANCELIVLAGGIPPLVALVKTRTQDQTQWAALVLCQLALINSTNRESIARAGGIPPLVTLAKTGSDLQKQRAAYALRVIASNNTVVIEAMRRADAASSLRQLTHNPSLAVRREAERALAEVLRFQ